MLKMHKNVRYATHGRRCQTFYWFWQSRFGLVWLRQGWPRFWPISVIFYWWWCFDRVVVTRSQNFNHFQNFEVVFKIRKLRRWRSTWNLIEICKVCGNQIAGHLTWTALTWDLNWEIFLRFNSPPTSETGLSLSWSFLFIKRWHFMGHPNIIACRPNLISMRGRTLYLRGLLWISTSVGRLLGSYEMKLQSSVKLNQKVDILKTIFEHVSLKIYIRKIKR